MATLIAVVNGFAAEPNIPTIKSPYLLKYAFTKEDEDTGQIVDRGTYSVLESNGKIKIIVSASSGLATSLFDGKDTLSVPVDSSSVMCAYGLRSTDATIGLHLPFNYAAMRVYRSMPEYKAWLSTVDLSSKSKGVQELLTDVRNSNLSICTDSNSPSGRHMMATADWDSSKQNRMVQLLVGRFSNPGSVTSYSDFQSEFGVDIPRKILMTLMDLREATSSPKPRFKYVFDLVKITSNSPEFN